MIYLLTDHCFIIYVAYLICALMAFMLSLLLKGGNTVVESSPLRRIPSVNLILQNRNQIMGKCLNIRENIYWLVSTLLNGKVTFKHGTGIIFLDHLSDSLCNAPLRAEQLDEAG